MEGALVQLSTMLKCCFHYFILRHRYWLVVELQIFFFHNHEHVLIYFVLAMTFSPLPQAASQGKSVDPNITKYSVKVLPVSWCACQFNSWIHVFLLSWRCIVSPAVQLWSEHVWISWIFQEAWFQVFWNKVKLDLSVRICLRSNPGDLSSMEAVVVYNWNAVRLYWCLDS